MLPSTTSSSSSRVPLRSNIELPVLDPPTAELSPENQPQIIYCVVAREKVILTEYTSFAGNFATVTRILLEKISPTNGQRKSYTYDNYVFHYITSSGLTYVCLADRGMGQTMPLKFLDEVCGKFEASFLGEAKTAVALQLNAQVQPVVRSVVEKYNTGNDLSSMERIRAHISEISDNMIDNIDKIMQRQEKIELLVEKTETLNRTAVQFRRQAINLRRTLWWRDMRAKITFVVVTLIIIFLIVMWICGGSDFHKCKHS
jgi:vesicle-associated membrane protein 7